MSGIRKNIGRQRTNKQESWTNKEASTQTSMQTDRQTGRQAGRRDGQGDRERQTALQI